MQSYFHDSLLSVNVSAIFNKTVIPNVLLRIASDRIQIRSGVLYGHVWVQIICKDYQQKILATKS